MRDMLGEEGKRAIDDGSISMCYMFICYVLSMTDDQELRRRFMVAAVLLLLLCDDLRF